MARATHVRTAHDLALEDAPEVESLQGIPFQPRNATVYIRPEREWVWVWGIGPGGKVGRAYDLRVGMTPPAPNRAAPEWLVKAVWEAMP